MAEFPVDPMMGKMCWYKYSEELVSIAAMFSVNSATFYGLKDKIIHVDTARKNFNHMHGDYFSLLQVYNQWLDKGSYTLSSWRNYAGGEIISCIAHWQELFLQFLLRD
ncbi:pre-mRNA-splicing factor ATP-dependent RNA helicase DHX16-like [Eurosta solidaginis]|uniref:pre-mRNA-splicing factor ATP-dependent RNA helicase DHX16-like n=1 Tax=Eurosta solidaginis TaxID=178769 RepID=UPI003530668D